MTVKVTKPSLNLREEIAKANKPSGIVGEALLRADSVQDARDLIGAGRKNLIINGGFDVWQRGTSFTDNWVYTADRWKINYSGATGTVSRQEFTLGQTDVPNNPRYYVRMSVSSADNNSSLMTLLEDVRIFSGQTVTLSFWAKGTNPPSGTFMTVARQNFDSGGSSPVDVVVATGRTLTSSWQKFTSTFTFNSVAGKTIGANNYTWFELVKQASTDTGTAAWEVDIANVQLELGSVATGFEQRSYGEELALCQRYYQISEYVCYAIASAPNQGQTLQSTYPVEMRTTPSFTTGTVHRSSNLSTQYPPSNVRVSKRKALGRAISANSGWVDYAADIHLDAEL